MLSFSTPQSLIRPRQALLAALLSALSLCAPVGHAAQPTLPQSKPVYVCPGNTDATKEYDTPGFCGMDERIEKRKLMRVAVLMFKGAQIIDYAGPMEIFGQAGAKVFTVAPNAEVHTSAFGLQIKPDYTFENAPPADILLIPGGNVNEIALNPAYLDWLRKRVEASQIVLSVCTGAFILGEAGLLDGLPAATTIGSGISDLKRNYPKLKSVVRDRRFVDTGKIITTAGLSAGIDGALHVVERWMGRADAKDIARGVEYDWNPDRKDSYGTLVINEAQMPMWHQVVPEQATWERYFDGGDSKHWETRARTEFAVSPQAFLDHSAGAFTEAGWVSKAQGKMSRTYRRVNDGQRWEMKTTLIASAKPQAYEFVVTIRRM